MSKSALVMNVTMTGFELAEALAVGPLRHEEGDRYTAPVTLHGRAEYRLSMGPVAQEASDDERQG